MEYLTANFPGLVPLWAMLAGLLVAVAEVVISVVPVLEAVLVVIVVVAVAPPFPITDSDPEGDLMWWQCRPPPCLLHFGVINSHMPLRYHHGFTAVQADPELANADIDGIGSTAGITPKKYGDSTTGGKAPNLVGVVR
ncbi:hypothetical protein Taro_032187 [Colocasia esculenta]|uniref:Uncharacterized protein n=1 Tax=Colocasia esculenta TaxID=4460 RepID=A0A843VKR2_COLES|nr:hypothetical protein [Colocasia esculenta]